MKTLVPFFACVLAILAALHRGGASPTPQLTLLYRGQTPGMSLAAYWAAVKTFRPTGSGVYQNTQGGWVLPFEKIQEDTLRISRNRLEACFTGLTAVTGGQSASLPPEGLVLCWEASTEVLTVDSAAYLNNLPNLTTTLSLKEYRRPPVLGRARSRYPPLEQRWCVTTGGDPTLNWEHNGSQRQGLGFFAVYPNLALYTATGELASGPSLSSNWLNVAADQSGNYWMWFTTQ